MIRVVDSKGNAVPDAVISVEQRDPEQSDLAMQASAIMDQVAMQFSPHVLLVKKGRSVVFPNSDQIRHHVYSFSKPNDFEIKLYSGDQATPVRFEHPGIVILGCNIHDQMVGYLYVYDNELVQLSDQQGRVRFSAEKIMVDKTFEVSVWHSRLSASKAERITRPLQNQKDDGEWDVQVELLPEVSKTSRKFKPRWY